MHHHISHACNIVRQLVAIPICGWSLSLQMVGPASSPKTPMRARDADADADAMCASPEAGRFHGTPSSAAQPNPHVLSTHRLVNPIRYFFLSHKTTPKTRVLASSNARNRLLNYWLTAPAFIGRYARTFCHRSPHLQATAIATSNAAMQNGAEGTSVFAATFSLL